MEGVGLAPAVVDANCNGVVAGFVDAVCLFGFVEVEFGKLWCDVFGVCYQEARSVLDVGYKRGGKRKMRATTASR